MSRKQSTRLPVEPLNMAADLRAVGRRIREIRGFDLPQAEFCRILGISRAQLSKYELGESAPTPDILLKLKAHSGKTIDWILTGEEERGRPAPCRAPDI